MTLIEDAFREFLLAKRADGLKPTTIKWLKSILNPVIDKFAGQHIESVTTTMMRHHSVDLRERDSLYDNGKSKHPKVSGGLANATIDAHMTALHAFWNWTVDEYQLAHNPMANIKRRRRRSAEPKAISLEDFQTLIKSTKDNLMGARNRAILMFMLDSGCRSESIWKLTMENLELDECSAYVMEKDDKRRAVYFTVYTAELLRTWLRQRPQKTSAVFCGLSTSRYGQPLTEDGFKQLWRDLTDVPGLKGKTNPHSLRHAYAREYLRNGGDLATLSRLMGHSDSVVTSWYYAVFTAEELAAMHLKHSPVNKIIDQIRKSLE